LLIVDDSPVALAFLDAVFRTDHHVVTASNGREGFEQALLAKPDLIVTDGLMPDIDGYELVRMLKADDRTAAIPVVMLTSGDLDDESQLSDSARPDAMVAKSMNIEPLVARVKALLPR
jgi:DNA-binding response OmpR family regulator